MMLHIKKYFDWYIVFFLCIISAVFLFYRLGAFPLSDWDEGIYSNISGEIARSHSWGSFHLQGTAWYEKEPIGFWAMALSLKVFGFSAFALRLPAALMSIFLAPCFFLIARKFFRRGLSVVLSGLFLFSPVLWHAHMLKTADLDALSLSFFLLSLVAYLYAREKKIWWLCAVFLALGFLSRGVLGFVHFFVILGAEMARPYFKKERWSIAQIGLFFLLSFFPWVLWHLYQWKIGGDAYIDIYWVEQFFQRISTAVQGHRGGALYYVDFFVKKLPVWYLFLFGSGMVLNCFFLWKRKKWEDFFLLLWLLGTLVPPHILTTKLYWYILPAMPALYLSLGKVLEFGESTFSTKKYIIRSIYGMLLLYCVFLSFSLWRKIHFLPSRDMQVITQAVQSTVPIGAPVVLRDFQVWNSGKTLPAFYWYLHYEKEYNIFLIDPYSTDRYIRTIEMFPWWVVSPQVLEILLHDFPNLHFSILKKTPSAVFVQMTR